jgi:hypothetical protein
MVELFSIVPVLHDPGLIAYECPRCGHVDSQVQTATRVELRKSIGDKGD